MPELLVDHWAIRLTYRLSLLAWVAVVVPEASSAQDTVRVDAITGSVSGLVAYGRAQTAVLKVENVNPFLYQFRVRAEAVTFDEGAVIREFARGLGVPLTLPPAPEKTTWQAILPGKQTAQIRSLLGPNHIVPDPGCTSQTTPTVHDAAVQAAFGLERELDSLEVLSDSIHVGVNRWVATAESIARVSGPLWKRVTNAMAREPDLVNTVREISAALKDYAERSVHHHLSFVDSTAGYTRRVANDVDWAKKGQQDFPSCQYFNVRRADASQWVFDTSIVRGAVQRLLAYDSTVANDFDRVEHLAIDPGALHINLRFGPFEDPAVIRAVVQRSPAGRDTVWQTIANPTVRFGRPGFALGVGIIYAASRSVDYQALKQYQVPPASSPQDTVVTVIAQTEDIRNRAALGLFLTGRLFDFHSKNWVKSIASHLHVVIASGPKLEQGSFSLASFAGVGISGLSDRAFLSVGAVYSREKELAKGFTLGGRIPAGQTPPTSTRGHLRIGVGLSVRAL